jgi:Tat protein secretion system quality control protein TatD with DNase activity
MTVHDFRLFNSHCVIQVYMSLSTAINEKSTGFRSLIAICPSDRILAESDTHEVSRCASRTWSMVTSIAEVKEWRIEGSLKDIEDFEGESAGVIQRLARNWESFRRGRYLAKEGRKASELELGTDEEEW